VSCAKMAQPIEMPFRMLSGVGPENHVLDAGADPPCEQPILRGGGSNGPL